MQNAIINSTHQTSVRLGARRMIGGVMAALVAFAAVPGVSVRRTRHGVAR